MSNCPICKKDDHVTRVTAIVDGGTFTPSDSFKSTKTKLSENLSFPNKNFGCLFVLSLIFIIGGGLIALYTMNTTPISGIVITVMGIIGFVLTIIRQRADIPHYNRAMQEWQSAYYCSRDDIIFSPHNPTHYTRSNEMQRFLRY